MSDVMKAAEMRPFFIKNKNKQRQYLAGYSDPETTLRQSMTKSFAQAHIVVPGWK